VRLSEFITGWVSAYLPLAPDFPEVFQLGVSWRRWASPVMAKEDHRRPQYQLSETTWSRIGHGATRQCRPVRLFFLEPAPLLRTAGDSVYSRTKQLIKGDTAESARSSCWLLHSQFTSSTDVDLGMEAELRSRSVWGVTGNGLRLFLDENSCERLSPPI